MPAARPLVQPCVICTKYFLTNAASSALDNSGFGAAAAGTAEAPLGASDGEDDKDADEGRGTVHAAADASVLASSDLASQFDSVGLAAAGEAAGAAAADTEDGEEETAMAATAAAPDPSSPRLTRQSKDPVI